MSQQNISLIRGSDVSLRSTIRDRDGNIVDITGGTVHFIVKKRLTDSDDEARIHKVVTVHTDPSNGVTTVVLTHDDTDIPNGVYKYAYEYIAPDGANIPSKVGSFFVNPTGRLENS